MKISNILKNKKVLVTGGAGFIGSNLIDTLLEYDNSVVCLDNFSTGKRENLTDALKNSNFNLIEGDIRDYSTCLEAIRGCEIVFHQAALGSVPRSIKDPITTTEVNIGGFVKMMTAAKESNIKRFIYAASSSTYGDHQALPKQEHIIGNALSPYAITKYVDELFAKNFTSLYNIETIGLRYFNVFGQRQNPDGEYAAVIPKFIQSLIKHQSPKVFGDGTFSRDFTFIENVIQANLRAATMPSDLIKKNLTGYYSDINQEYNAASPIAEVFNVAYGKSTTLNQLVSVLKRNLKRYDNAIEQISSVYEDERAGDIPHSLASIRKAQVTIGYTPEFDITQGIEKSCQWYWENSKVKEGQD